MIRHLHPITIFIVFAAILLGYGLAIASRAIGDPNSIEPRVTRYADTNATAICLTLTQYPTIPGVTGILEDIEADAFSPFQAGEIIALAVLTRCPQHQPLLQQFADTYTPEKQVNT